MLDLFAVWGLVFVISVFVLVKAADYFIESAEDIGLAMGIPKFVLGISIVAAGTSMPELVSSMIAAASGSSEIVAGNILGSNITNLLLIIGLSAVVNKDLKVERDLLRVDLPFLMAATFLMALTLYDGVFGPLEALLCIAGAALYVRYAIAERESSGDRGHRRRLEHRTLFVFFISIFLMYVGARYVIESVVTISHISGIGTEVIAATAVALGTSLPELTVTFGAARKGNKELAIGNILGSNIFNALGVMGIASLFGTLVITQTILSFALPMTIVATLLFFFMAEDREITKWDGYLLLLCYLFFVGKIYTLP